MRSLLAVALRTTGVTLVLTGLLYPLLVTGLALLLFPARAQGSWVTDQRGQVVGSELLAQGFSAPVYFQPRPSAAGAAGYDATASSGSNLGPTSKKLRDGAAELVTKLHADNPDAPSPIPVELVTASGSGLDPHLSPAAARWQVPRVARARRLAEERVRAVVEASIEGRTLGFLGEPRVNVLLLNLALDRQFGRPVLTPAGASPPSPAPR
jgi:K+-transporting ATPase ATPase C chain